MSVQTVTAARQPSDRESEVEDDKGIVPQARRSG
jgi:hypothetical protein